jgi:glucose dehydrogenase
VPSGGQATPMNYVIGGRQYLVIAAGGYKDTSTRGDYLIAYALPR